MDTVTTWIARMDDLHHLDYLAGRLSPPGLPGWTTFPTWMDSWITWMDDLRCLNYLDEEDPPRALLRWTTFTAWFTSIDWTTGMENLHLP
eukprot:12414686-Karenia_brevis.AAC.1